MAGVITHLASLLEDPKYSDLEIRCEDRVFKVHRAIVCLASPVLAAECDGSFKESEIRVVEHSMFSASAIELMLQYIYKGHYAHEDLKPSDEEAMLGTDSTSSVCAASPPDISQQSEYDQNSSAVQALNHVEVFRVADYYDIPSLRLAANLRFAACCSAVQDNDFLPLARAAYAGTAEPNSGLRGGVQEEASRRAAALLNNEEFVERLSTEPELQQFAIDFLLRARNYSEILADEMKADIIALTSQIESLVQQGILNCDERLAFSASNEAKNTALERTAKLTYDTESCRNCRKEFGGYLDGASFATTANASCYIRCRGCRCKHTI